MQPIFKKNVMQMIYIKARIMYTNVRGYNYINFDYIAINLLIACPNNNDVA